LPILRKPIDFETTFGTYHVNELIGEGGAGRVYGGTGIDGSPIAVKLLAKERASTENRRRFKNELSFLLRNKHRNIVAVIDHGLLHNSGFGGPFYVMRRYKSSLRDLIKDGIAPDLILPFFLQILDGVEAAHLLGVVHRDLKPENILYEAETKTLAIADFGIASFTETLLATPVETAVGKRLANFAYAAPEQRSTGKDVSTAADIYALGLMLNEMFTGDIPHGNNYSLIGKVAKQWGFLDAIVEKMLQQSPADRYASMAEVKGAIGRYQAEAISLQRISEIDGTVIKVGEIDEPLALTPPKLIDFDWNRGQLTLILDRPVTDNWVQALYRMANYGSIAGKSPESFVFRGNKAMVQAEDYQVQTMINNFKNWLPTATQTLRRQLEQKAQKQESEMREHLRRERESEEQRLRVFSQIKI